MESVCVRKKTRLENNRLRVKRCRDRRKKQYDENDSIKHVDSYQIQQAIATPSTKQFFPNKFQNKQKKLLTVNSISDVPELIMNGNTSDQFSHLICDNQKLTFEMSNQEGASSNPNHLCNERMSLNGNYNTDSQSSSEFNVDNHQHQPESSDPRYHSSTTTLVEVSKDCSDSNENMNMKVDDVEDLRKWAASSNTPLEKLDELLAILRRNAFPDIPKCAKTFLCTTSAQYKIELFDDSGEFVYFGISVNLKRFIISSLHPNGIIELLINVDGIPLFRSSSKQFWPLLCQIFCKSSFYKPFPVAVYCGDKKPSNINKYLEQFVSELNDIQRNGLLVNGKNFCVRVKAFICDRPARSVIKCVKNHGGFYACERCLVKGVRVEGRTVYPEVECESRTHQSFVDKHNKEHHIGISPLLELDNCDMVNMFVLDFMHLACLGCMKKLLTELWLDSKSAAKMSQANKIVLCQMLNELKQQVPEEFQRTTRDISEIQKWKATEYRLFLLYVGPIVLKYCLSEQLYKHFLLFSIACRILSSDLAIKYNNHAKSYLISFVNMSKEFYGAKILVLNMHSLIHLADDAKYLQDSISYFTAFPFESLLGKIKLFLRCGNRPLAQLCRRLHENNITNSSNRIISLRDMEIIKKKKEDDHNICILKMKYKGVILTSKSPNNTVLLKNGKILEINKLFLSCDHTNEISISGVILKKSKPMLQYPCNSEPLEMWRVTREDKMSTYSLESVICKMVTLVITNEGEKIYSMPLLHMPF